MNPFLRNPRAFTKTPVRAERPEPKTDGSGTTATLRLYDPIDGWGEFWGISAKEFTAALDELPDTVDEIRLLINSPGGEVYEALAILNSLRAHQARVVAVVEGIAASAASFIAAGVDELHIMENAQFFVHKAIGVCVGNGEDMTKMSTDLDHHDRNIASIYARKAGGSVEDWLTVMSAETYYSADEAKAAGLADSVIGADADSDGGEAAVANARNRFDLSAFANASRPTNSSAIEAGDTRKEATMANLKEGLAERFGFDPDADDETVLQAVDEALAEQTSDTPTTTPAADATPDQLAAVAAKFGLTLVNSTQAQTLEDLTTFRNDQLKRDRESFIDNAISEGRFAPAVRDTWLDAYEKNPEGTRAIVDSLPKNTIPVFESGHGQEDGEITDSVEEDPKFKQWMEA
ncbi:head maturation protease, ClpP-related [Rhodococcus sp. IEGM 1330]|uniref:head maturation protease, ClpP-related n=1 Tax=Rhodococcus sp. IEGM 1330 TaxID=3082225 RepID=UPI0029535556|nr:head maturation protease, ClpP-related [Rhodococcus sp. IEGM 1330]MDV8022278.1 ATP-dependent Clp protease proteolytic subunit [Rhodococcus sp. IEGM 1330]